LNPEARLLDETTTPEDPPDTATGEVGVWLQPRPRSSWSTGAQKESPSSCPQPQEQNVRPGPPTSDLLPESTVRALSDLYFAKVHPIIPILNEEEYRRSLSHFFPSMPLVHAVCLVVAKDSDARHTPQASTVRRCCGTCPAILQPTPRFLGHGLAASNVHQEDDPGSHSWTALPPSRRLRWR